MATINGRDVATGDVIFSDNPEIAQAFWDEVHLTSTWARFIRDFGATPGNNAKVLDIVATLHGDVELTTGMFTDALNTGMDAGELARKPVAPPAPVAPPVPVDIHGRPLSASQLAWSEMTKFADVSSMKQINDRKKIDPVFAQFVLTSIRREMQAEIDGDVSPFNAHLAPQTPPSQHALANERLVAFASRWTKMSTADIRAQRSRAINPNTAQQFIEDELQCMDLGLL